MIYIFRSQEVVSFDVDPLAHSVIYILNGYVTSSSPVIVVGVGRQRMFQLLRNDSTETHFAQKEIVLSSRLCWIPRSWHW